MTPGETMARLWCEHRVLAARVAAIEDGQRRRPERVTRRLREKIDALDDAILRLDGADVLTAAARVAILADRRYRAAPGACAILNAALDRAITDDASA